MADHKGVAAVLHALLQSSHVDPATCTESLQVIRTDDDWAAVKAAFAEGFSECEGGDLAAALSCADDDPKAFAKAWDLLKTAAAAKAEPDADSYDDAPAPSDNTCGEGTEDASAPAAADEEPDADSYDDDATAPAESTGDAAPAAGSHDAPAADAASDEDAGTNPKQEAGAEEAPAPAPASADEDGYDDDTDDEEPAPAPVAPSTPKAATMGDVEDAKAATTGDVEDAKAATMGDVEDAKAATMGDVQDAKAATMGDVEDAKAATMGDVEDATPRSSAAASSPHIFETLRNMVIERDAGAALTRTESRSGLALIAEAAHEQSPTKRRPAELILLHSVNKVHKGRGLDVLAQASAELASEAGSPQQHAPQRDIEDSIPKALDLEDKDDDADVRSRSTSRSTRSRSRSRSRSSSRASDQYDDAEFSPTESESMSPVAPRGRKQSRASSRSSRSSSRSSRSRSRSRSSSHDGSYTSYAASPKTARSVRSESTAATPAAQTNPSTATPAPRPKRERPASRALTPAGAAQQSAMVEKSYDSSAETLLKSRAVAAQRCTAMIRKERERRNMVIESLKETEAMKRLENTKSVEEKKKLRDGMFQKFLHTRFEKNSDADIKKEIAARKAYWPVLLPTHIPNRMEAVRELWRSTRILEKDTVPPEGKKRKKGRRRRRNHELDPITTPQLNKDFSALAKPLPRVYEAVHPRYLEGKAEKPKLGPLKRKPATPLADCESPLDNRSPLPSSTHSSH